MNSDLIEIEDQIQFTHVVEVLVKNLYKIMDGFQVH